MPVAPTTAIRGDCGGANDIVIHLLVARSSIGLELVMAKCIFQSDLIIRRRRKALIIKFWAYKLLL